MRDVDPDWNELAERYRPWISDGFLQYRADEIRRYEVERAAAELGSGRRELEIGSNRGRFLTGLCKGRPEVAFFGIEIKGNLAGISARRLVRNGLENGRVLHGDAKLLLPVYFGESSLDAIYVLFPDPWWKERHAKRRMISPEFLRLADHCLRPGGHLVVATDVPTYATMVRESADAVDLFDLVDASDVPGQATWVMTTRERHCVDDGIPIHRLCLRTRSK